MPHTEDDEIACCSLFRTWADQGKAVEGYRSGYGKPYIAWLLGLNVPVMTPKPTDPDPSYPDRFIAAYDASGSDLMKQIIGPNGWTILQVAIIRAKERDAKKLAEAQAYRAWVREIKENESEM